MVSHVFPQWTIVTMMLTTNLVNLQMPMHMYPMTGFGHLIAIPQPPPIHVPVPVAVPVGIPIPVHIRTTTTTTTTTTDKPEIENNIAIAFPIPIPMPVQFAIPAMPSPAFCQNKPGNPKCPPCPPCTCSPCTPSFFSFCSPCHQVCRCKRPQDAPVPLPPRAPQPLPGPAFPMPIPLPMGSPLIMVPFPPLMPQGQSRSSSSSACSSLESSSSEEREKKKKRPRRKKKKRYGYRRSFRARDVMESSDNDLVKPMLSYVAENGEIKMNRRLSRNEAVELIGDGSSQHIEVVAGEDSNNRSRLQVVSRGGSKRLQQIRPQIWPQKKSQKKQVMLRHGLTQHLINKGGNKKLIFRPPANKKISNLSVSFQVDK